MPFFTEGIRFKLFKKPFLIMNFQQAIYQKTTRFIIVLLFIFSVGIKKCNAQLDSIVILDSAMVQAAKAGFSVADFIQLVKDDTSFYHAFKNLHYYAYDITGNLNVVDKSNMEKATLSRQAIQLVSNRKKWIVITDEKVTGKIYKRNGSYNYYTAELFDHIFFPLDTTIIQHDISRYKNQLKGSNENTKNTEKLKVLIFNPGAEVKGVPLVGNKLNIFDEDMQQYYDYSLTTSKYNDSLICYVFACKAKLDAKGNSNGNAVIKELISYFDKKTFNVIARKYVMRYNSFAFDFDVTMDIKLQSINHAVVPVSIAYSGFWDIAFKKKEAVNFKLSFYNWKVD
jgi:hypothetical protein